MLSNCSWWKAKRDSGCLLTMCPRMVDVGMASLQSWQTRKWNSVLITRLRLVKKRWWMNGDVVTFIIGPVLEVLMMPDFPCCCWTVVSARNCHIWVVRLASHTYMAEESIDFVTYHQWGSLNACREGGLETLRWCNIHVRYGLHALCLLLTWVFDGRTYAGSFYMPDWIPCGEISWCHLLSAQVKVTSWSGHIWKRMPGV